MRRSILRFVASCILFGGCWNPFKSETPSLTAYAGPDQIASLGDTVIVVGSAVAQVSQPEGSHPAIVYPGSDPIVEWAWDFGDGKGYAATGAVVTYVFTELRTYLVRLRVTDKYGNRATSTTSVTVVQPSDERVTFARYLLVREVDLHDMGDRVVSLLAFPDFQIAVWASYWPADTFSTIRVFDVDKATVKYSFVAGNVLRLFHSSDGGSFVVRRREGESLVVDAMTGEVREGSLPEPQLVSPDGRFVVSGGTRIIGTTGYIQVSRVSDGVLIYSLDAHEGYLTGLALSPDGETIVSGGTDGTIKLWRLTDGRPIRSIRSIGQTLSVATTPDGRYIVSGSADGTVRVWWMQDGRLVRTLPEAGSQVDVLSVSSDSRKIMSGSLAYQGMYFAEGWLKVWERE